MSGVRWLLGAAGAAVAAYGGWLLVTREDELLGVAAWLVAGVLLHDAVLAVTAVALGALTLRLVPEPARAPTAVAFVVLAPITLVAVPVLGRFGASEDNPTLLDRDYTAGWLALVGLTVLAVLLVSLVRSHVHREGGADGPGPRGR